MEQNMNRQDNLWDNSPIGAIALGGCSWSEFQQSVITVQEAQLGIRRYLMHRYAGPDRIYSYRGRSKTWAAALDNLSAKPPG